MSKKLPVNDFKWVEDTSQFTKDYTENYNENNDEVCFLEFEVQYPEN